MFLLSVCEPVVYEFVWSFFVQIYLLLQPPGAASSSYSPTTSKTGILF